MIKQPGHLKGPKYHTVEFQPWEGGPSTPVRMKVRASLLKAEPSGSGSPLPAGRGDSAESSSAGPAAGAAATGTTAGTALDGREEAPVDDTSVAEDTAVAEDAAEEALVGESAVAEAVAGATRGVLTRKAVREVEQRSSMDANDAGVGDKAGSDGELDVGNDMEATEEGEAGAKDGEEVDGWERGGGVEKEQKQGAVEEQKAVEEEQEEIAVEEQEVVREAKEGEGKGKVAGKGSVDVAAYGALDVAAMIEAGQPLDNPLKPAFVPVGTRIILIEPTSSKPRGGSVSGADLVGKTVSSPP